MPRVTVHISAARPLPGSGRQRRGQRICKVHATVTWVGGCQAHARLTHSVARVDQLSYYPTLAGRIRALIGGPNDKATDAKHVGGVGSSSSATWSTAVRHHQPS